AHGEVGSAVGAAMGAPIAPAHAGETSKVGRDWPLGFSLMCGDASLRFGDLSPQIGHVLRRLAAAGHPSGREAGRFEGFQGLTVLLELNPMPGDPAVAVRTH